MKKMMAGLVAMAAVAVVGFSGAPAARVALYHEAEVITISAKAPASAALYYEAPTVVVAAKRSGDETRTALYWEAPTITATAKQSGPVQLASVSQLAQASLSR